MPGGKRTDRISQRDLEILEFIARFGVVPRSAVSTWAGTRRTVTITRERRLREAGLIEVSPGIGESGRLLICTKLGLRLAGRSDLRLAQLSMQRVQHESVVALLAAELERAGDRTLSEREILARERAAGERVFSASLSRGRFHRADLLRVDAEHGDIEAVEVELTTKGANRLDEILRAWRRAVAEQRVHHVVYRCSPLVRPYVERAVARTSTSSTIAVEPLLELN
jgi:hypothetical protein